MLLEALPAGSSNANTAVPPGRHDLDLKLTHMLSCSGAARAPAFSELYRATSPRIYGLVLRVLRCPDHAAEVTQEVYLEVWRQAARYDPTRGGVLTWMTTIAHRRAVDRVRTVTKTTARDQRYAISSRLREIDCVWDTVASRADSEEVRRAVSRLSAIQREALLLAYFDGRTRAEIAALLSVPISTVKTRIRDALIALRQDIRLD